MSIAADDYRSIWTVERQLLGDAGLDALSESFSGLRMIVRTRQKIDSVSVLDLTAPVVHGTDTDSKSVCDSLW